MLVLYADILEVKYWLQVSRQLSIRLHLRRHFQYISRARSFERDQFRINRLSMYWDLSMLCQKQYDLVIEKFPVPGVM